MTSLEPLATILATMLVPVAMHVQAGIIRMVCTRFRSIKGHCARSACENGRAKTQLTLKNLSEFSFFLTYVATYFPRMGVARMGE